MRQQSKPPLPNKEDKSTEIISEIKSEAAKMLQQLEQLSKYEYLRITLATDIPAPAPIISINVETISTGGNITTISGASKSGKSAFTGWLIAGAISRTGIINDMLEGLTVEPNPNSKAVLQFDTEQARHKHQANVKAILRRSGLDQFPEYYLSYNLRQLDVKEYKSVTSDICEQANIRFNGVHLIVIDGIADYISSVNDDVESNEIVKFIEELAIKYSAPVIVIIHTNPNSDKERGHLGSQCQRKSESVLMVRSEGDISYLEPKFLRMAGKGNVPIMQFMFDKNKSYHVGIGNRIETTANKDFERLQTIERICKAAFAPPAAYKYNEAIERIMRESKKGETTAKNYFKEMNTHELIKKGEDDFWRLKV